MLEDIPHRPFPGRVGLRQIRIAEAEVAKRFVACGFEIGDELHVTSLFRTGVRIYPILAVKFPVHEGLERLVVIVADHPRHAPLAVVLPPEGDEFRDTARSFHAGLVLPGVAESMLSGGDGSVAIERIHLKRPRYGIAVHFPADVLSQIIHQLGSV